MKQAAVLYNVIGRHQFQCSGKTRMSIFVVFCTLAEFYGTEVPVPQYLPKLCS